MRTHCCGGGAQSSAAVGHPSDRDVAVGAPKPGTVRTAMPCGLYTGALTTLVGAITHPSRSSFFIFLFFRGGQAEIRRWYWGPHSVVVVLPPPPASRGRGGKMAPAAAPLSHGARLWREGEGGKRASPRARPSRALPPPPSLPPSLARRRHLASGQPEGLSSAAASASPPPLRPGCLLPGPGGRSRQVRPSERGTPARPPAQPTSAGCVRQDIPLPQRPLPFPTQRSAA